MEYIKLENYLNKIKINIKKRKKNFFKKDLKIIKYIEPEELYTFNNLVKFLDFVKSVDKKE